MTAAVAPALPEWVRDIRPDQRDACYAICDRFDDGNDVVFLEGPTGTGKTLIAELVRRQLDVAKTLYVCSSIALQTQFVRDFPYAALIKAADNYSTMHATWPTFTCGDCDSEKVDGQEQCSWCEPVDMCPYRQARAEAVRSPLTVTNTAYALHEWNHVGRLAGRDLVVIDECDTLEQTLMGYVEFRVPGRTLVSLRLTPPPPKSRKTTIVGWLGGELLPTVQRALSALASERLGHEKLRWRKRLLLLRDDTRRVITNFDPDLWVRDTSAKLALKPVQVAPYGPDVVWRHGTQFLLMSATVVSADQMAHDLGIDAAGVS